MIPNNPEQVLQWRLRHSKSKTFGGSEVEQTVAIPWRLECPRRVNHVPSSETLMLVIPSASADSDDCCAASSAKYKIQRDFYTKKVF